MENPVPTRLRICLAGAAIDNGNRGVSALGRSVVDAILAETTDSRVTVFDDGFGVRSDPRGVYPEKVVDCVGVRLSKRVYRPESWARVWLSQRLGEKGVPVAERISGSDAVFDLSGGDSFSDLYGISRFRKVLAPKRAALRADRPLVLLPQTYGPFRSEASRAIAADIVRSARVCYARDPMSFAALMDLAGRSAADVEIREGVDVAFALQPRRPVGHQADEVEATAQAETLVGVNVSGLLSGSAAPRRFGIAADYFDVMTQIVRDIIRRGAIVLLVSHVHGDPPTLGSDAEAIGRLRESLTEGERSRTLVAPLSWDVAEMKWAIAQCEWFVGSRMHATIAALSTGVPAFGYAYSDKTYGVFETCAMGAHVRDARTTSGSEASEAIMASFEARESARRTLYGPSRSVVKRARAQLADLFHEVHTWREDQQAA